MSWKPATIAALFAGAALACLGPQAELKPGARSELPPLAGPAARPTHLVLVSLAGLGAERYREDRSGMVSMPALASLARAGVAADAVEGVTPASVHPAHATLVTGELPAAHGITADFLLGANGVRDARFSHASKLRKPTLWQLASEAKLPVAALAWPTTVGAEIAQRLPDLEPTRSGETWLGVLADAATPSLLTLARAAGGGVPAANAPGPERDAALVGVACALLASQQAPRLILLRLSQTEPPLLQYGPDSPEANAAFSHADAEIARLFACLRRGPARDATALFVVGDHGYAPIHSVIAPNAVLAKVGLLTSITGIPLKVARWSAIARSNGGSAFIYAEHERDAVLARTALAQEAAARGGFRVVAADELLRDGADPEAWFALEAEPGFAFSNTVQFPMLAPAAWRGIGGYLPTRRAMNTGFVAWGRGLRGRVRIPLMQQADVAPTAAKLLGIDLGKTTGRPLVGALDLPRE